MQQICKKCGCELNNHEIINEKCDYCSHRKTTKDVRGFGIILFILSFPLGIIYPLILADMYPEFYDGFDIRIMFYIWVLGFCSFLFFHLVASLFSKLDSIIFELKKK